MVEEIEIPTEEEEEENIEFDLPTLDPWVVFSVFMGFVLVCGGLASFVLLANGAANNLAHLIVTNSTVEGIENLKQISLLPSLDKILTILDKAGVAISILLIFVSGYIFLKLRTSVEGLLPFVIRFAVPFMILMIFWPTISNWLLHLLPGLAYALSKMYYCSKLFFNWWVLPVACFLVDLVFGYGLSLLRPETESEIEIEQ